MALEDLPELSPTSRASTPIVSLSRIQVGTDALTSAAMGLTTAGASYTKSEIDTIITRLNSIDEAIRPAPAP